LSDSSLPVDVPDADAGGPADHFGNTSLSLLCAECAFLELVVPSWTRGGFLLLDSGQSFYHLAFLVADVEASVDDLVARDYELVTVFESEAFEGRICAFVKAPTGELLELIQE
jgi:hypothetical protein